MRIIFEEHQYELSDVHDVLYDITRLQDVDKMVSVSYVGHVSTIVCSYFPKCFYMTGKRMIPKALPGNTL